MGSISNQDAAHSLKFLLQLEGPPIAITFNRGGTEPSTQNKPIPACSYWGRARTENVQASPSDHFGCPQGAEIVGFKLPPNMEDAKCAAELLYQKSVHGLDESIVACPKPSPTMPMVRVDDLTSISYAPLDKCVSEPDVVLLICNAYQAMIMTEIYGQDAEKNTRFLSGFPACTAVAGAYRDGRMHVTFGCEYSRLFTPFAADKLLVAFPGRDLSDVVQGVERVVKGFRKIRSIIQAGNTQFQR
ncbi:MAG: DUF169 domain-containing protein [Candidatus Bathyarchaeia archaeon]